MICTLTIFGLNDYFWSRIVPNAIYGTSALDYKRDYFIKKGPMAISLQLLSCTPILPKLYTFLRIKHTEKKEKKSKNEYNKKLVDKTC
jgi:hypothetical protein